jgi:transcriptional regulator with XRE-family HTH domain
MVLPDFNRAELMPRTLGSARHEVVRAFLVEQRRKFDFTQAEIAAKLKRHQSFIATIESGQRRIDIVELLDLAEAIGFDPKLLLRRMKSTRR